MSNRGWLIVLRTFEVAAGAALAFNLCAPVPYPRSEQLRPESPRVLRSLIEDGRRQLTCHLGNIVLVVFPCGEGEGYTLNLSSGRCDASALQKPRSVVTHDGVANCSEVHLCHRAY